MNFLPIVARELRVVSRKRWLYWIRSMFALVGIVAALVMFYEPPGRDGHGEEMLWLLSGVTLALALLNGCLLTADCISSEKREDTLGFLFLTNLKGYDIVAGKISIHAITTACGLLAVLPVFFLPLLAGGVTWGETLRVLLAIAVSFMFALSLGVWISTRSQDARNAVMATLTVMSLLVVLPLLWLAILDEFLRVRASPTGLAQLSPGMLLYYARDEWYARPGAKAIYWISLGIFAITSAVLSAWASGLLPKTWQTKESSSSSSAKSAAPPARWQVAIAPWKRVNRFSITNPFQDLLLRRRNVSRWGHFLQRAAIAVFVVMLLFSFAENDWFALALLTLFAMHAAIKFVFALDATRALNEDKRSSALELLLATPLREREITEGLAGAFKIQFRRHVQLLFALTLAAQFVALINPELRFRGDDFFFVSSFLWAPMIWTWSDYRVVSWIGIRHALRENSHTKAMLRTFGEMVAFPWAPYFLVLFWMAENRVDEASAGLVNICWAVGAAIYQAAKARRRRVRADHEFRNLISSPDQPSRGVGPLTMFFNLARAVKLRSHTSPGLQSPRPG